MAVPFRRVALIYPILLPETNLVYRYITMTEDEQSIIEELMSYENVSLGKCVSVLHHIVNGVKFRLIVVMYDNLSIHTYQLSKYQICLRKLPPLTLHS